MSDENNTSISDLILKHDAVTKAIEEELVLAYVNNMKKVIEAVSEEIKATTRLYRGEPNPQPQLTIEPSPPPPQQSSTVKVNESKKPSTRREPSKPAFKSAGQHPKSGPFVKRSSDQMITDEWEEENVKSATQKYAHNVVYFKG